MRRKIAIILALVLLVVSVLPNTDCRVTSFSAHAESINYRRLNDPDMLRYVEDSIYSSLVETLDSDQYFVENVSTVYISKEYLRDLKYNSKANVFFGYTLAELDAQFESQRYVFTLGDNGETTVVPYVATDNSDHTLETILENVAIGSGVILICVTVSIVTAGTAPAVSIIFAASAKTATIVACRDALFSGVSAGIVKGIETGDFSESLKAAAVEASEQFKWGAIWGALDGGKSEFSRLKGLQKATNMSMNDVAKIQKESKYPLDVIKQLHSYDEYTVYRDSGLTTEMVDNKLALTQEIDLDYVDEMGRTNLERMKKGLAAIDPGSGESFELHHIGQRTDSTLAILKPEQHSGNDLILHNKKIQSVVRPQGDSTSWDKQRKAFWKSMAVLLEGRTG